MKEQAKIDFCKEQIRKIRDEYTQLNKDREEAIKFYSGDPSIVTIIEGRSQVVTTDIRDAIKAIKPDLLEIFAGGDEVVSLQPEGEEDVKAVKLQEQLVNKQVRRKNPWYTIMSDFLDDVLLLKFGAIKFQWHEKVEYIDIPKYEGLNDMQAQAVMSDPKHELVDHEVVEEQPEVIDDFGMMLTPAVTSHNVTMRQKIEDEYVLLEAVPAENLLFPITTKNLPDAVFVSQKTTLTKWDFIEKYGKPKYNKVKDLLEELSEDKSSVTDERFKDLGGVKFVKDANTGEFIVYECFFKDHDTGEPWIFSICGDICVYDEKNLYKKPPFHGATAYKMAHRAIGDGIYDMLKDYQLVRTAIKRQILDNVYQSNYRRYFGDPDRINLDDYLNNNATNAFIRTVGDPSTAVMPEVKAPLPPEVFQFWEMLNMEKDFISPAPRAFMGVNPQILNKTARGQNQQINQASKPLQMMARLIAEMAIAPLMQDVVNCNIRFMKKETSVRYLNEWVPLNRDNIVGNADYVVNVGIGTGNKNEIVSQMQQLLALYAQIYKAGVPIVTSINPYNAMKELVKAMGFKNTSDFVTDPDQIQSVLSLVQYVGSMAQQAGVNDPKLMKMLQATGAMFGMGGQKIASGTMKGQNTPPQAQQPAQGMQPRITPDGGGFYG